MKNDLEQFIDERLNVMSKHPLMYGQPNGIHAQCLMLIEMYNFCIKSNLDLLQEFQKLKQKMYPDCPAAIGLDSYLAENSNYNDDLIGKEIVNFFIELKKELSNGQV